MSGIYASRRDNLTNFPCTYRRDALLSVTADVGDSCSESEDELCLPAKQERIFGFRIGKNEVDFAVNTFNSTKGAHFAGLLLVTTMKRQFFLLMVKKVVVS
ncbi:hypothetical protein M514_06697, partial [Trichuris suis]